MVLEDVYEIVGNVDNKTININKDYYESLLKNYENKNINTTVKIFYEEVLSKSAANKYSFKTQLIQQRDFYIIHIQKAEMILANFSLIKAVYFVIMLVRKTIKLYQNFWSGRTKKKKQ